MKSRADQPERSFWGKIRFLGGNELFDAEGGQHAFTYRRSGLLLIYLALAGQRRTSSRDVLAGLLWPDKPTAGARANLRQLIADIKRTLGDCLVSSRGTVALKPEWLDLIDVVALTQPLPTCPPGRSCHDSDAACCRNLDALSELYSGPMAEDLCKIAQDDLSDWLEQQQLLVERQALTIERHRFACHRDGGRAEKALQAARRYSLIAPYCEIGQQQLLELLCQFGHYQQALTEFEHFRSKLKAQLDAEPSAELESKVSQIRHQANHTSRILPNLRDNRSKKWAPQREIRQLTVVAVEVTVADAYQDDAADRIEPVVEQVMHILRLFGGHVLHPYGGKLLAYYSYPQAREESCQQAALAARRVTGLTFTDTRIHVGIHTGSILTGIEPSVPDTVGETTRIATQIQALSEPGEVLVSETTYRLLKPHFLLEPHQQSSSLGGDSIAAKSFLLLRQRTIREQQQCLPKPVGIEPTINRLFDFLDETSGPKATGSILRLTGPAGTGKTFAGALLRQRARANKQPVIWLQADATHLRQPFHPILKLFTDMCELRDSDSFEIKLGQVVALLEQRVKSPPEQWLEPLALWLQASDTAMDSLGVSELNIAPPRYIQQLVEDFMLGWRGTSRKLLVILDNGHWCDRATIELLCTLAHSERIKLLLIHRDRADELEQVSKIRDALQLSVARIDRQSLDKLLIERWPELKKSGGLRAYIAELSGGRAGFACKLVDDMRNSPNVQPPYHCIQLQDLLTATYDALGGFRFVAQTAAILGLRFRTETLANACELTSNTLQRALAKMQAVGLIQPEGPEEWSFCHHLYWEAGFRARPKAERDQLRALARALQSEAQLFNPDTARAS